MEASEVIFVEYIDEMDLQQPFVDENGKTFYKCPHCPKVMEQQAGFQRHLKLHQLADDRTRGRKKTCKLCNYVVTNDEDLAKHVEVAHSQELQTFNSKRAKQGRDAAVACLYCGLVLDSAASFYEHAKKEHLDQVAQEWELCEPCQDYFPSMADLLLHKNVKHVEKPKKTGETDCAFCSKSFTNDTDYQKHVNSSHKDAALKSSWLQCEKCPTIFATSIDLSRHKVQRHFHQMLPQKKPVKSQNIVASPDARPKPMLQSTLGPKPRSAVTQGVASSEAAASRASGEPMMVRVDNCFSPQDGVLIYKQADSQQTSRSPAKTSFQRGGSQPAAKRSKPNPRQQVVTTAVAATHDQNIVYVIAGENGDQAFILPEVEQQGNQISGLHVKDDAITFQVKSD